MAWTSPRTWVVSEKITAAIMNTHVRDNLAYLKSVVDGTLANQIPGSALSTAVALSGSISYGGNTAFTTFITGGLRVLQFDTNDYIYYDPVANTYNFDIGAGVILSFGANGKITGTGFYDSGDVSVTNGTTQSFTHGLGGQPRFFSGVHNDGSGVARKPIAHYLAGGTTVAWFNTDTTTVQIVNNTGATRLIRTMLML